MDLDLRQLLRLARRWWWLLVLLPAAGLALGHVAAARQAPRYAATATIMVAPISGTAAIDYGAIQGGVSLAGTYQQLIGTWPVLQPVIADLGLPYGVDQLRAKLTATAVPNTLLIAITATDRDPHQAAAIANAVARHFGAYLTLQAMSSRVAIATAVPAQPPAAPYAPRVSLYLLLGGLLGFLAACGLIGLLALRDTTVKSATDVQLLTGRPLLSAIPRDRRLRRADQGQPFFLAAPDSPFAEAIRLLRAKVVPSGASHLCLTVTSPDRGDGTSTLTANLAVALAQSGAAVVVVDANLRSSSQHRLFGVDNDRGLTTLLADADLPWRAAAHAGRVPNLLLLPSGPLLPNAVDLLDGDRLRDLLAAIGASCDVLLLDTPAILQVSDALAVASNADGALLVCSAARTSQAALGRAAATLRQGGVGLVGTVLNRQSGRGAPDQEPTLLGDRRWERARVAPRRHPTVARRRAAFAPRPAAALLPTLQASPRAGAPAAVLPDRDHPRSDRLVVTADANGHGG